MKTKFYLHLLLLVLTIGAAFFSLVHSDESFSAPGGDSPELDAKERGIVIIEHPEDDPSGVTRLLNVPHGNAVLDNIIVGTMDGRLVCLEANTGREMWSIATGSDMIKSSIVQLIPSLNGNLYLYNKGKLDKHPMSVYDIVAKSPFSMNDDLLYIGSKETQLYSIDPELGDSHKCTSSGVHACGDFKSKGRLLVMRSDYLVKAVDRWTGEMRWNISLGEYSTTSPVGLPMPKEHFSFPFETNFDDFDSTYNPPQSHTSNTVPIVPTHGLLSAMDGSLRLIEIASSKTVWAVSLSSPAIHMQNNIYTSRSLDFVLTDLKFVPQLLLHLDSTQLREGESRVFIAEHNNHLIAIEQLSQYEQSDTSKRLDDGEVAPQLDSKSNSIFSFPSSPETTPVALPLNPTVRDLNAGYVQGGLVTTIDEGATHGVSFFIPTRKCTGPQDMSLDCLLGIHYIVMDPCCVGDNCMCDATLKLPDKPTPETRPNQNLTLHPTFDWESGDYDSILRAIIMFDWYRQQIRAWPAWVQVLVPLPFLLIVIALIRRGSRYSLRSPASNVSPTGVPHSAGDAGNANPTGALLTASSAPFASSTSPASPMSMRSTADGQGVVHVGRLQVHITKVLGHGSSGTIVFEGMMNGRKVAVKRMLKTFYSIAERETHLLTQTDEHPNVIRYYTTEEDADFIYLALSFAERSLANFIEDEECFTRLDNAQKRNLLHQLAHGMRHLHEINIVHRDIKPQNVLITGNGIVKISDMGLAKKLENDSHSLSTAAHGTVGWQAPELVIARVGSSGEDSSSRSGSGSTSSPNAQGQLSEAVGGPVAAGGSGSLSIRVKVSKRVDIFSLGCLFFYVLTKRHPFGDRLVREANIVGNTFDLSGISAEAADMVSKMLSAEPKKRPTAAQVLEHPYFWEPNKRLRFLKDASDFFEFEKPNSEPVVRFENAAERAGVIPNMNWVAQLPDELLQDLNKFRKYNGAKLRDLLRVIRNKAHHYRDLPPETQATFGPLPEGFLDYFCLQRFPDLLTFTWNYARNNYAQDKVFSEYFPHGPGHVEPDAMPVVLPIPQANANPQSTASPSAAATQAGTPPPQSLAPQISSQNTNPASPNTRKLSDTKEGANTPTASQTADSKQEISQQPPTASTTANDPTLTTETAAAPSSPMPKSQGPTSPQEISLRPQKANHAAPQPQQVQQDEAITLVMEATIEVSTAQEQDLPPGLPIPSSSNPKKEFTPSATPYQAPHRQASPYKPSPSNPKSQHKSNAWGKPNGNNRGGSSNTPSWRHKA